VKPRSRRATRWNEDLRRNVGDTPVDALRETLEALLARHGALDDARAGRSRAPW
jgi:hypothetical protein